MTIIHGLPVEEYHASPCVSSSKLGTFVDKGARAYWLRHVKGEPRERSDAMRIGQAFEDAVCGNPTHVVPPEGLKVAKNGALSTKEAKEWKASVEASGKFVLDPKHASFFEHGVRHVHENTMAMALIKAGQEQVTLRRDWEGLPGLQARPDWLSVSGCKESGWQPYAADLKTTRKSLEDFAWEVRRYGYHRQAAVVDLAGELDELGTLLHPLIVVEKAWPYRCQVMWMRPEFTALGHAQAVVKLGELAEHYQSGEWPAVTEEETDLYPPGWRHETDEDEEDAA